MAGILFLIIGFHKPSSRKRVLDSVAFLESRGHRVSVREFPQGAAGRVKLLADCRRHDLVVIQKKLLRSLQLTLMKRLNPRILFDLDDAVMFHEIERDQRVTGKFFHRFVRMAGGCKGVIAGNHYLAEFARAARVPPGVADDNVVVLPTPVDTSIIPARAKATRSDPLVIGWIGTRGNLSHLKQIAGPLATVCGRHNGKPAAVFRVVSDARPDLPGVPLEYKPWSAQSEIADLQGFDIGVMPLSDDLWTRGKGGFKLLQYMAAGAAAIASPIGINQDVVRHGVNGLLAADETDWGSGLQLLVGDPVFRERLAGAARETVERDYSLEAYNRRLAVFLERML